MLLCYAIRKVISEDVYEDVSEDCDIKGNVSQNTGEKIYHMPDQQFYDVTNAEEMFCTEEEAQDAGYRKSLR